MAQWEAAWMVLIQVVQWQWRTHDVGQLHHPHLKRCGGTQAIFHETKKCVWKANILEPIVSPQLWDHTDSSASSPPLHLDANFVSGVVTVGFFFFKGLFADNSYNRCCQKIEGDFLSCKPTTMKAWKLRNAEENSRAGRRSQQVTLFTSHRLAAVTVRLKSKMSRGTSCIPCEREASRHFPSRYLPRAIRQTQSASKPSDQQQSFCD